MPIASQTAADHRVRPTARSVPAARRRDALSTLAAALAAVPPTALLWLAPYGPWLAYHLGRRR
jgi:hypothetical protein